MAGYGVNFAIFTFYIFGKKSGRQNSEPNFDSRKILEQ